ncbi:hypothetical protein [Pantoea sp. C2G6]|uniref:hypothetical protein n=1 Tax=Pantoea sp. C2G6 TaxID=3243084 RepID=UPI003ED9460F
MKTHPVTIKKISVELFERQLDFNKYYRSDFISQQNIPSVLEPLGTKEITIDRDYDISKLEYIEQVQLIDSLNNINSECVITFVSILGEESIVVPVQIDSQKLFIDNFNKRKDTGMNGSPIKAVLEKRGINLEW